MGISGIGAIGAAGNLVGRFFGNAISNAFGYGLGAATHKALSPPLQLIVNDINAAFPFVPPEPGTLALGVAQGQVDEGQARSWAAMHGIGETQMTALIDIATVGPGGSYAFELWRRGVIGDTGFRRALRRLGLEPEWINDLAQIKDVLLTPAELANARQQGYIDQARQQEEAGLQGITAERAEIQFEMVGLPPGIAEALTMLRRGIIDTGTFAQIVREGHTKTKYTQQLLELQQDILTPAQLAAMRQQGYIDAARQHSESAESGIDAERADLMFEAAGLPPGHGEAQQMLNRGIITAAEFAEIIRQGHTKTQYTGILQENARRWLSAIEWVDAHLRGHATEAEMYAGTAAQGVTKSDTDILFASHGRGLTTHQITTGIARGGALDGPIDQIPEAYIAALRQGSIQPRYYNLDYANRYTIPSFFVIRALIQDGTLTVDAGADLFKQSGWPPELADAAAKAYGGSATTGPSSAIRTEEGRLRTTAHRSYVAQLSDDQAATAALTESGLTQQDIGPILTLWKAERTLRRLQLTPGDIRKAYQQQDTNAATGAVWTLQDALDALVARGYPLTEAQSFLNIPYKG